MTSASTGTSCSARSTLRKRTDRCSTASQSGSPTGADCAPAPSPCTGFEGIQIFDIRNLRQYQARGIGAARLRFAHAYGRAGPQGRNRVLIYNSVSGVGRQANPGKYGNQCPGEPFGREDIVEVPLDDPEEAEVIGSFDLGENPNGEPMDGCHDVGVILGRVDRAACAGHPMGLAVFDVSDLDDPEFLYSVEVENAGLGNTVHGLALGRVHMGRPPGHRRLGAGRRHAARAAR